MNGKLFFVLDTIVFFAMLWSALYLRHSGITSAEFAHQLLAWLPIFLWASFILWLFSFYDVKLLRKRAIAYKRLAGALIITLIGAASVIYFLAILPISIPTPRRILLAVLFLYFSYIYLLRRNYFKLDFAKNNVLIFGNSPTIAELVRGMKTSRGYRIKSYENAPVAGKKYNLKNVDLIIVGSKLFREVPQTWDMVTKEFIAKGACVDTDFNAFEAIFQRVSRESIEDSMWLLRGIANRREHATYAALKRVMDLSLACVLLPFLVPLGCLIWLIIWVVDKEKPIFKQKRIGLLEKEFYIYKFRTINSKTQETEQECLTKTGPFLRRFRLDEIPQVINVLKGDISFVGPRPLWVGEIAILNTSIPNHSMRSIVKPGITGWAQLNFKAPPNYKTKNGQNNFSDEKSFDAAFTRFSYDVWYIKNHSVLLDIEIMVKTGLRMFIKDSKVNP